MKKVKYYYNTHTLRYEKLITPLRVRILRVFAFMATAVVTAGIIVAIAFKYIQSPNCWHSKTPTLRTIMA